MGLPENPGIQEMFAADDRDQWEQIVAPTLRGKPLSALDTQLEDGLTIQALYTQGDHAPRGDLPGIGSLRRGSEPLGPQYGWDLRQVLDHPNITEANRLALSELMGGCSSLQLRYAQSLRDHGAAISNTSDLNGLSAQTAPDLDAVLEHVALDMCGLSFDAGAAALPIAAQLCAVLEQRQAKRADIRCDLNIDPLGTLARTGFFPYSIEKCTADIAAAADFIHPAFPQVRLLLADGMPYHEAGADAVQELAAILATGVYYLRALADHGMDTASAARLVSLRVAMDADQFRSIAKIRVLRQTWTQVLRSCGIEQATPHIQAASGLRMYSVYDPWVNLLRGTVACFAAATAGADAITISPFDQAIGLSDDAARRMARNTQVILQEESHLHKVIDPAGGSWYVESLCDNMAAAVWSAFQSLEAEGGILAALRAGSLQQTITTRHQQRRQNIGKRKTPLTGVSEFADANEGKLVRDDVDLQQCLTAAEQRMVEQGVANDDCDAAFHQQLQQLHGAEKFAVLVRAAAQAPIHQLAAALAHNSEPESIVACTPVRLAEDFEQLRELASAYANSQGDAPHVFLANIGALARYTVRATWIQNLLAAGGLQVVNDGGFDAAESCAAAAQQSQARVAVICGHDDDYTAVPAFASELKSAGIHKVYCAGRPGAHAQDWRAAGVDAYLHLGCPVLDELRTIHDCYQESMA